MDVRAIDMTAEAELLAAFDLETVVTREVRGDSWSPLPAAVRVQRWVDQPGFTYELIGAWDGARLIGLGQRCVWDKEPDDVFVEVAVAAPHRRQGVGTRLVESVENGAGPGARRFISHRSLATREQVSALEGGFASATGYRLGSVEILMEVNLADHPTPAVGLDDAWRVETYVDGIPHDLRPAVGVVQGLVDEASPSGDVEWHAHVVTPQEYQEDLEEILREGSHLVEAVAFAPGGQVAGWSGLRTAVSADVPARVLATMVLQEFRGHGLGMALKSAVGRRAGQLGVARLATESDRANRWMLDINRRQGFVETGVAATFQKIVR